MLVVGAGGLGCPVLTYLAASGVGSISIMDGDIVDVSNLQRQVLFSAGDVGEKKADVAARTLQRFNPDIMTRAIVANLGSGTAPDPSEFDLVVDGTDNFAAKYFIDDWAAETGLPWIFGSIFQFYGQVAALNVDVRGQRSARLRDIFAQPPAANRVRNCSEAGIMGAFAGVVGCLQAMEALKLLCGLPGVLADRMLTVDVLTHKYECWEFDSSRNPGESYAFGQEQASMCAPTELDVTWGQAISLLVNEGAVLVDVRTSEERACTVPGEQSSHIPMARLQDELERIASMRRVIFYCQSGWRSGKAAEFVRSRCPGVTTMSVLGGMNSYQSEASRASA